MVSFLERVLMLFGWRRCGRCLQVMTRRCFVNGSAGLCSNCTYWVEHVIYDGL